MKIFRFISVLILIFVTTSIAKSDTLSLYSDSFGNTYGSIGGNSVNLYSDSFGNTYGSVGGSSFNSFSDSFGNTYGSFGN